MNDVSSTKSQKVRTVVCAVDFSEAALRAAEQAQRFTEQLGAERLILLHVHVPDSDDEPGRPTGDSDERLEALSHLLPECTVDRRLVAVRGETVQTILRIVKEESADLLVIGTEGKTGIRRTLFGSVAEAVMRAAQVPVLVVRGAH